jgi:hypothetical protein
LGVLLNAETGRPIARLRPSGRDQLMEILYRSLKSVGPPSARSDKPSFRDEALQIIASNQSSGSEQT